MEQQKDDVETSDHQVKTEQLFEGEDEIPKRITGKAGQASVKTSPARSHIVSDAEEEEAPVTTTLPESEGKADNERKEPIDSWDPVPCAPEDDPLMGEFNKALLAGEKWDDIVAKGAGRVDPFAEIERLQKEIRADLDRSLKHLDYSTKVFEALEEMTPGLIHECRALPIGD